MNSAAQLEAPESNIFKSIIQWDSVIFHITIIMINVLGTNENILLGTLSSTGLSS